MTEKPPDTPPRVEIDWFRIAGGALAAVCSAVLLSTLGEAGTIVGAALGSVVLSVGTSIYSTALARSRHRMSRAQEAARRRVGVAQAEVRRAARRRASDTAVEGHLNHADDELREARIELEAAEDAADAPTPWRQRLAELPWKRISLVAVGMFVGALVLITVFELIAGRPVASFTGGTNSHHGVSLTNFGGGSSSEQKQPAKHRQQPGENPTPGAPTSQAPTEAATPTSTPTETPTETPTGTPTPAPTAQPSGTPTPTSVPTPTETTTPTP